MKLSILSLLIGLFVSITSNAFDAPTNCDFYFKTQNLCATLQWLNEPSGMDANGSFRLFFWKKDQGAQVLVAPNANSIAVKLFMPDMGHGGGLVKVDPAHAPNGALLVGEYDATRVGFMMSGMWQIIVQLKGQSNTVLDAAQIDYQAP
jgi:hypothetical protein